MAEINIKNRGLTLIELLIYMSIFSIIFIMITSSVFYLQKIIQNNNQNYYVKNQVYQNLNILQQYLYRSRITITDQSLNLFDKNNKLIFTQNLDQGILKNTYEHKTFNGIEQVNFERYNLELTDNNRILKIEFSWLDNRGKVQNYMDYLIVINRDS